MKINQRNALTSKVQEVLHASSEISIKYKTCVREKIRRQTKILDENATEEFLDEICNDPQKATQLLQGKLYGEAPSASVTNAVSDIQEKYQDIQQLEKSVQQVYQLFVDLAILVHAQGEQIDNIEISLGSAKTYVGKAEKNLTDAKKDHQELGRKCVVSSQLVLQFQQLLLDLQLQLHDLYQQFIIIYCTFKSNFKFYSLLLFFIQQKIKSKIKLAYQQFYNYQKLTINLFKFILIRFFQQYLKLQFLHMLF
ncbi:unnamed protein product [Paramecium sonneborni]|uniref:t-SNARE coiled-coil homology domain-containing protein n=1 Tax=Paramecium sonneborni TaxID=65129 RepID=A0A8S1K6I4_9CILI|nr:unnamed protein product [Paramecium sonneborni]